MNRFPKDLRGDRVPQTNPAHWGDRGACYSSVPLPRRLPGELVRVVARRGGAQLPPSGVVVRGSKTTGGLPWYQVLAGGAVHELWAEELEDL